MTDAYKRNMSLFWHHRIQFFKTFPPPPSPLPSQLPAHAAMCCCESCIALLPGTLRMLTLHCYIGLLQRYATMTIVLPE